MVVYLILLVNLIVLKNGTSPDLLKTIRFMFKIENYVLKVAQSNTKKSKTNISAYVTQKRDKHKSNQGMGVALYDKSYLLAI